jgi:hypothetical protein
VRRTQAEAFHRIAGAAPHGDGAANQRFFDQRLDLRTEARLTPCQQSQTLHGPTAHDIRWIIVERHQQPCCAQPVKAGSRNSGDHQSEMGTGSPVLSCFFWAESKQPLTVRREKFRLFPSDAAGSIGSMMPKNGIGSEQCAYQRFQQVGIGENFRGCPARVRQSPMD